MGAVSPDACLCHIEMRACVREGGMYAGGSLVAGVSDAEPFGFLGEFGGACSACYARFAGVRHGVEERAQGYDELYFVPLCHAGEDVGICAPLQVGLGPDKEEQRSGVVIRRVVVEVVSRPASDALVSAVHARMGSDMGEVVELFGIDFGELLGAQLSDEESDGSGCGFGGVGPTREGDQHRGQWVLGHIVFYQVVHSNFLACGGLYFTSIARACQTKSELGGFSVLPQLVVEADIDVRDRDSSRPHPLRAKKQAPALPGVRRRTGKGLMDISPLGFNGK